MGKSVEELRRILERMQKDLERHPSAIQPPSKPSPARVERLEDKSLQQASPQPMPVEVQSAFPRDVFGAFDAETLWTAWKSPRALLWGATVLAILGIVLRNLWIVALGFLGLLIYALFWHTGDGNLNLEEMEDLSQRVAILERRLASRSLPSAGGISRQATEELEELRVMVRSLYRVLQGVPSAREPVKRENAEGDD